MGDSSSTRTVVDIPKEDPTGGKAASVLENAKALVITSPREMEVAEELLSATKELISEVKLVFDPICAAANRAHKAATAGRGKFLKPLEDAKRIIEQRMAARVAAMEREERERVRKQEEEAALEEEMRLAMLAEKAREEGDEEKANRIESTPVVPVVPEVVVATTGPAATAGASRTKFKDKYVAKVVDADRVPREWCIPDEKRIQAEAESVGTDLNIPGVTVLVEKVARHR